MQIWIRAEESETAHDRWPSAVLIPWTPKIRATMITRRDWVRTLKADDQELAHLAYWFGATVLEHEIEDSAWMQAMLEENPELDMMASLYRNRYCAIPDTTPPESLCLKPDIMVMQCHPEHFKLRFRWADHLWFSESVHWDDIRKDLES